MKDRIISGNDVHFIGVIPDKAKGDGPTRRTERDGIVEDIADHLPEPAFDARYEERPAFGDSKFKLGRTRLGRIAVKPDNSLCQGTEIDPAGFCPAQFCIKP
ncbi:MAG: hypothetical protein EB140_13660 [Proteobacteria bacterium]|nr:hypothetical protein [Pseudomonadota bacterium]